MSKKILVINPGSTSIKLAYYLDKECLVSSDIEYKEKKEFASVDEEVNDRLVYVENFIEDNNIEETDALACRGGLVYGLRPGAYLVDEKLELALKDERYSSFHASNLGGLLGKKIAEEKNINAYIYDAVTSGELSEVAEITGLKEIKRRSFSHILNSRAMAYKYAEDIGRKYEDLNLIVAHLGSGVSMSVHKKGHVIDTLGDHDGQFSPERAGCLPSLDLIKLCYSGKYDYKAMHKMIRGNGGMKAHLGTGDCRIIEKMIEEGNKEAELVFKAEAYQIAKSIGLLSVSLKGDCDAVILTGGMAYSEKMTEMIKEYVSYIGKVAVMPGQKETEALAYGILRVLNKEEEARLYDFSMAER